jgi:thioester reductase-like protein
MRTVSGRHSSSARLAREGAVLLTGATGLVGMELLARFLERTDRPVLAVVRGRDAAEAEARLRRTVSSLVGDADRYADRLVAVRGDIERPALGLDDSVDALAESVTDIVHGAASVSFELGLPESRAINVEGTRRMLELAALCARRAGLRSFNYISTAYVAGDQRGPATEEDLDVGQQHRNAYERTKFEAEQLVRAHAGELPVSIFRPSIVVGDRRTGWTQSFNVLYGPLRAFAQGAYAAVPARRTAPVDVVSVDYVADAIFALATAGPAAGQTYHLTAGDEVATVGELVDLAAERFGRPAPVAVPPALYRRVVSPLLLRAVDGRRRRMLRRSEVYFPYFAIDAEFDDTQARAALGPSGIRPAPLPAYFDRLVAFALRARWGQESVTRHQARQEAGLA